MLPCLAASGHNLYTWSVWIYLEKMSNLEEEHPDIYESFVLGMHVVRRFDRFWAGLPTDLIIEQMLMRSLKTSGGLTRGTGFKEIQRNTWLFSISICSAVNLAMQEFTDIFYHKRATPGNASIKAKER